MSDLNQETLPGAITAHTPPLKHSILSLLMEQKRKSRIFFLNLTTFSVIGGIEKFNKCLLKALSELEEESGIECYSFSTHDNNMPDERYFPLKSYKGFSGRRVSFVIRSLLKARNFDQIILGHINLAIIGILIKLLFPKKRVIIIIHGVEGWKRLKGFKSLLLKKSDLVLTGSNFTKTKLEKVQGVKANRIKMFYNTIDPYFSITSDFDINIKQRAHYGLTSQDFILFTLSRLSHKEMYKGYDVVIKCLPELLKTITNIKYVIGGPYDEQEKERLDEIIKTYKLKDVVKITGCINESEIQDHYKMANLFIMPSYGEGFGIVFIEAMVMGLPVIAGNKDGSVDALKNGELGTLVNPGNTQEIIKSVQHHFENKMHWSFEHKYELQQKTLNYFGFKKYKQSLKELLLESH